MLIKFFIVLPEYFRPFHAIFCSGRTEINNGFFNRHASVLSLEYQKPDGKIIRPTLYRHQFHEIIVASCSHIHLPTFLFISSIFLSKICPQRYISHEEANSFIFTLQYRTPDVSPNRKSLNHVVRILHISI